MPKKNCILCGNTEAEQFLTEIKDWEYNVIRNNVFMLCSKCRLVFLNPIPTLAQLKQYYPPDYHGFYTAQNGFISVLYKITYHFRFKDYVRLIGRHGAILDVGCADAPYFDLLRKKYPDMDLMGLEFKDEIAQKGRLRGNNIITGTIDDILNKGKKFDLIIMNNLIEHVIDPIEELNKAKQLLKPDAYIILETPNTDSWDFMLAKKYWGGLHAPRHIFLVSDHNIIKMAQIVGLEVQRINYLLNTDHWALSVQNYFQSTFHYKTKLIRGRSWYYKYLLLLFIPINIIQKILCKTGSISVVLQKRNEYS